MILNVTGVDCAGKSTLVSELLNRLGWQTIHFSQPKDMQDGKNQYLSFINGLSTSDNYVTDRLHEGEYIYAPVYRGYTADYLHDFEGALVKRQDYLMVYVRAELDEILRRASVRGEDFVREGDFQTIIDLFEGFILQQAMPWIEIDTTNSKTEDNVRSILDAKDKILKIWSQYRGCPHSTTCTGIFDPTFPRGNVNARYMIIGQNPGGQNKRLHSTAFGDGPTSTFLMNILREADILRDSWITNLVGCPSHDNKIKRDHAINCDTRLTTQLVEIQPKKVIVLGADTARYLNPQVRKDFEVIELKHPQYVRRFRSKYADEYVEQFKKIMEG